MLDFYYVLILGYASNQQTPIHTKLSFELYMYFFFLQNLHFPIILSALVLLIGKKYCRMLKLGL